MQQAEASNAQSAGKKEAGKGGTDLKDSRSVCKGSMHVALSIACKDGLQTMCRIIYIMISPVRGEHGHNAAVVRSPTGARYFDVSAAKG